MMSPAQGIIAAMITPALLILASGSLVASALLRLGRVVDRSRAIIAAIEAGNVSEPERLRVDLDRHAVRARLAERSVALFFCGVVVFVLDCLSIGVDDFVRGAVKWLPVTLTIAGMCVLVGAAGYMVAESRLGAEQIMGEIERGKARLAAKGR
jgi:hypothetical protein